MRQVEASVQHFGEFLLRGRLVGEKAAPHCVRWVRRFLMREASDEPLADRATVSVLRGPERDGRLQDWQVRQAEQALQINFVNFLD